MLKIIRLGITLSDECGNLAKINGSTLYTNEGIDIYYSGDLISYGLVMFDEVKWISFHSGYGFGYLIKIMSWNPLPKESEFRSLLSKASRHCTTPSST